MGIQFDYRRIEGVEIEWTRFYSCNASVKRSMLERVGGFDEERFPYGYEDLELARRLAEPRTSGCCTTGPPRPSTSRPRRSRAGGATSRRIAASERRSTDAVPGERAYFYEEFRTAAEWPHARGRPVAADAIRAPGWPLARSFVWKNSDLVCRQRLAPEFLAEWEAAELAADGAR